MRSIYSHGVLMLSCILPSAAPTSARRAVPICVAMRTDMGQVVVELRPDRAPKTVENFLRYVDSGRYGAATFHRVVTPENDNNAQSKDSFVQGGLDNDPIFPSPPHEPTSLSGLRHVRGTISMGRGAPGTAGSVFFVTLRRSPALDFGGNRNPDLQGFAAFGRVVRGLDVLDRIQRLIAGGPAPDPYFAHQYLTHPVAIRSMVRLAGRSPC